MANVLLGTVVRHLHELAARPQREERTDRQLLGDFTSRNDQEAFLAIVRRHGPLVFNVCRHVLHHNQDAEDAFQATFLVLARKAASLRRGEALASWLHGVAYHLSTRARRDAARRRSHEAKAPATTPANPAWTAAWREVQTVLDLEIELLPEKYRAPFVLCILEGQSRAEAARQLGLKEGTVWSRLSQARERLRERLARRGVTLSAVLALAGIGATQSEVRAHLLDATARTVLRATAEVSPNVLRLAEATMKTMLAAKLKLGAVVLAVCGLLMAGVGFALQLVPGDKPAAASQDGHGSPPAVAERGDGELAPRRDRYGDPLPDDAVLRLGTVRLRHGGLGGGLVAFSGDGTTLTSVHGDGVVHFWDAATGRELRSLRTGRACFTRGPAALSSTGNVVALPTGNQLSVWDLSTGKELRQDLGHGTDAAPCLAFSPDCRLAATGAADGVRLWEVRSGKEQRRFDVHAAVVTVLAFAPDGPLLASKERDGKVFVWDTAAGKELYRVQGNPDMPADLAWSPDGKTLAFGEGKGVVLLDSATGRSRRRLDGLDFPLHSLAFSPDGKTLAAGAGCGLHFWELAAGTTRRLDLVNAAAGSVTFSPDGKTLAATGTGSVVRLWDVATGTELQEREGHRGALHAVAFSPDGRLLATGGDDSTVRLWDTRTGRQVGICQGRRLVTLQAVLFAPDGKSLFTCAPNNPVQQWDVEGKLLRCFEVEPEEPHPLNQASRIALPRDRTTLIAVGRTITKGEARFLSKWDLQTGKQQAIRLIPVKGAAWPEELSPDGSLLARLDGSSIHLGDVAGDWDLVTLSGPREPVVNVTFAPDNRVLAGVCQGSEPPHRTADGWDNGRELRTLVVWELATGKELLRRDLGWPGPTWGCPLAFSPAGRFVAVGGENGAPVRLWDLATGKELPGLKGEQETVTCLTFSPDGTRLATGLRNGVALVWDVPAAARRARGPVLEAARLEQLWVALAAESPAKAHEALWELVGAPDQAVALLREHLRPVASVEAKDLERLIADLDSAQFKVRTAAAEELAQLGPQAEAALRRALTGQPSAELRRRAEELLAEQGLARSLETVRRLRGIGVLEALGSKEAKQVLEKLAEGASVARETQAAKAALERLALRTASAP